MDRIRGQITTPVLIGAGAGLVLGLILGLFFAWQVWPVNWVNAPLENLQPAIQRDYLAMTIQTYAQTGDRQQALQRWEAMGPDKETMLTEMQVNPPAPLTGDAVGLFAAAIGAQPGVPAEPGVQPGATPAPGGAQAEGNNLLNIVFAGMCILTLVIAGILAYMFFFRNRRVSLGQPRSAAPVESQRVEPAAYSSDAQDAPIVQYLTTYNMGNDLYDDSFSIDSPSGEFLGECGVGISDTIGVGDPKKVTAFEVWLFDKNDIQTVTKVVMSAHVFNDPAVSQRLASKGEPVLAEPGKRIILETATLQLEARIVNMNYGQGALPPSSFFEQITLELAVWQKA
jgi:hypothetical protein